LSPGEENGEMSVSERTERARQEYIGARPSISCLRAAIWTESHKATEGEPTPIRRAKAFAAACEKLPALIFPGELIVGTAGEHRRTAILTPEFSWTWVDREMDGFDKRPQDPYLMTDEQRAFVRNEIWPYWKGKSLEEAFLKRVPEDTARLLIDTGILDNDSKWRQAVGEITPDYQDILFPKGFRRLAEEAREKRAALRADSIENMERIEFYDSAIMVCEGIVRLAARYAEAANALAAREGDAARRAELVEIARVCAKVPAEPPESFREACQFLWFVQLGGVISENPLALNAGRFDQYMYPFYKADIEAGRLSRKDAQELVECLWLKFSEWVWTVSSNTASYFAGYNQFQNLTLGGRRRDGRDGANELSYVCLEATESLKTHQPGVSVRIHPDCPEEFLMAVAKLIRTGTGFPAVHNDQAGTQMLLGAGYEPEDARDWSNCGCVVPHFRKTGEWTSAVNVNFGAALEYALNAGRSRMSGAALGLPERPPEAFADFREIVDAFLRQLAYLVEQAVIGTVTAQRLHMEMVPRPFLSVCVDGCMEKGKDLSRGGAKYNIGPVLTGIGLGVVSNSLAAIRKLVFDEKATTLRELARALDANWEGFEALREKALAAPKYGNDDDYVDALATEISDFYYRETRRHRDVFGSPFNSAFMGISNYVPTGKIVGALPCGRKAGAPLTEGVSPFAGSDVSTPLAVMRSAAKVNHEVHAGGTLLNIRLNRELLASDRGLRNLGAMIRAYFALGAFHVQFNTVSTEELRKAQAHPEEYRDLLVRVAGYSTQFVNLSREMQEAIIARTEHGSF
jgi:formate C-acetyltransferase